MKIIHNNQSLWIDACGFSACYEALEAPELTEAEIEEIYQRYEDVINEEINSFEMMGFYDSSKGH